MNKILLEKVYYMPKELVPGKLYVSEEFKVAAHLCPCGCGNRIVTPLLPANWTYTEHNNEPTLYPSLSNWQLPCKSHYWIKKGMVHWSYNLTQKEARESWEDEEQTRAAYYENHQNTIKKGLVINKIKDFFSHKIKGVFTKNRNKRKLKK